MGWDLRARLDARSGPLRRRLLDGPTDGFAQPHHTSAGLGAFREIAPGP